MSRHSVLRRREFLGMATSALAAGLVTGCGDSKSTSSDAQPSATGAPANAHVISPSDAPETTDLKFGIIALTDCSPLVIAHEKGLFKKYGINSTISKGASWAAIRDALSNGDIHGTHMLIGMPIASTMGLLGSPKKPMVIPWMLNRNGQSISLSSALKG
jgi:nitrate/nitrite transport system substrate-binding protein